jgi:hypothetical protein
MPSYDVKEGTLNADRWCVLVVLRTLLESVGQVFSKKSVLRAVRPAIFGFYSAL